MESPDRPASTRTKHLTGVSDVFGALRNLGLIRFGLADHEQLGYFQSDDGHAIPVHVSGSGPPVILVHGLGCSHTHWRGVARRLARRHRVYAADARGHGRCRLPAGARITLPRLAADLANLIDFFRLERSVLVGHSMGALTVMQYLQDHGSSRVAAVCLVDQSPRIVTDESWRLGMFGGCSAAMLTGLIQGARTNLAETVLHEVETAIGERLRWLVPEQLLAGILQRWFRQVDVAPLLELCETLAAADFRPLLPRLDRPVLVALGGRSAHYSGVPLADYYRRTLPYSLIVEFPRAGHSPHFAEPARFARELAEFIGAVCD